MWTKKRIVHITTTIISIILFLIFYLIWGEMDDYRIRAIENPHRAATCLQLPGGDMFWDFMSYQMPCAIMARATFMKPATLAPFT